METGQAGVRSGVRNGFAAELLHLASERLGDRAQARAVVEHAVEALRRRSHAGERVGNPKAFLFQTVRDLTTELPAPSPPPGKRPLLRADAAGASGRPPGRRPRAETDNRRADGIAGFGVERDPHRRLRAYAHCIDKLTRRDRKILLLRRLHGLKPEQAAERSGLPAAMVEDRLASSLRRCWRAVRPPAHAKLDQQDPVLIGIAWYARLEGGGLDRDQLWELECWLRERASHARAYRIAESLWRDSALLQAAFDAEGREIARRRAPSGGFLPKLLRRRHG